MIWFVHSDFNTMLNAQCTHYTVYFTTRAHDTHLHTQRERERGALHRTHWLGFRVFCFVTFVSSSFLILLMFMFLCVFVHTCPFDDYIWKRHCEIHSLNFNYVSFEFGWINCEWLVILNCNRHTLMYIIHCSNFN